MPISPFLLGFEALDDSIERLRSLRPLQLGRESLPLQFCVGLVAMQDLSDARQPRWLRATHTPIEECVKQMA